MGRMTTSFQTSYRVVEISRCLERCVEVPHRPIRTQLPELPLWGRFRQGLLGYFASDPRHLATFLFAFALTMFPFSPLSQRPMSPQNTTSTLLLILPTMNQRTRWTTTS